MQHSFMSLKRHIRDKKILLLLLPLLKTFKNKVKSCRIVSVGASNHGQIGENAAVGRWPSCRRGLFCQSTDGTPVHRAPGRTVPGSDSAVRFTLRSSPGEFKCVADHVLHFKQLSCMRRLLRLCTLHTCRSITHAAFCH